MLKAQFARYCLHFRQPARTSREVLTEKPTYFIKIFDESAPETFGIGECAVFKGLSFDDRPDYETKLAHVCDNINDITMDELREWPSILFGIETAMLDLKNGGVRKPFPSAWSDGDSAITINGLVWMGSIDEMRGRIEEKIAGGFKCLKFKIGGEDFNEELSLIRNVRERFSPSELEIRLDANGAFTPENALNRIGQLAPYCIHSLEQPVRAGQIDEMARICRESPIDIALDEELIGVCNPEEKYSLLEKIRPSYVILKPTLCGGISGSMEWISIAELQSIGWWATSALESNIGLNAIAQWVSTMKVEMPQGLGTGALYTNNIPSPIIQTRDVIRYNPETSWDIPNLEWK